MNHMLENLIHCNVFANYENYENINATMVEENFLLRCSEMLQNEGFHLYFSQNIFTMGEENFIFRCTRGVLASIFSSGK